MIRSCQPNVQGILSVIQVLIKIEPELCDPCFEHRCNHSKGLRHVQVIVVVVCTSNTIGDAGSNR